MASDIAARPRRTGRARALACLAVLLLALAAFFPNGPARGQTLPLTPLTTTTTMANPFCSALAPTSTAVLTASCSFETTTAVAPGGTLVLEIEQPSGVTITNVTGLPGAAASGVPGGCTVRRGLFTSRVEVVCDFTSSGIPSGTSITETVALPSTITTLTEEITYNASTFVPSPILGTPPTTTRGNCRMVGPAPTTFLCTNTTGAPTSEGGTLTLTITAAPDQTVSITGPCDSSLVPPAQPTSAPCFAGTCPLTTALTSSATATPANAPITITSPPSGDLTITYTCTSGESVPAGTQIQILVTSSNGGTAQGGAGASTTGICTASSPATPPATTPPTFTCTNVTSSPETSGQPSVPEGGTLTLTFVAAPGQEIAIAGPCGTGSAPCTAGTCPLTTPLPAGPAATLTITYACASGESVPAATTVAVTVASGTAGTCVVPVTPPPGFLCTNTTGAATPPGGTLVLAITAAPGQSISVPEISCGTTVPCTAGTCPLSTALPVGPTANGGTLTITYSCTAGESVPGGTTIAIGVTNANNASGTPTEVTTANAIGGAAVPTEEVTTSIAPGIVGGAPVPGQATAVPPTTEATTANANGAVQSPPPPTTQTITFAVCFPPAGSTTTSAECNQTLGVTLTAEPQDTPTGQLVTFTASAGTSNTGATIVAFLFNFGDGSAFPALPTSQLGTVSVTSSHTYAAPGVYTVVVEATDSSGNTGFATTTVGVATTASFLQLYQPPPPNLARSGTSVNPVLKPSPSVAAPGQTITFTYSAATEVNPALAVAYVLPSASRNAATAETLSLDFGDGTSQPLSTQVKSVTHAYTSPGQYTATLTATDSFGNVGQATAQVFIPAPVPVPPMNVTIDNPPATGTTGSAINFDGEATPSPASCGPIKSYSWDFGDGSPPATGQIGTHTYTTAGTYTVTLTVTDCSGGTATATTTITISDGGSSGGGS